MKQRIDSPSARSPRGLATLATLMLLLMASLLAAAWAQRNSLNEVRTAANQLHATRAFEAAEAGLAWAQAMLNTNDAVGPDCQPAGADATATTFRSRYLQPVDPTGRFMPRTQGVPDSPLKIACLRGAAGWQCSCAVDGAAPAPTSEGAEPTPMFELQMTAGSAPGSLDVMSVGCSHVGKPCARTATDRADANSRLRLTLAFLPTLATPPVAALTTIGAIDAASAALGLHNADALSGGLAARAGAAINGSALRVSTAPGSVVPAALLSHDESLAALSADQLFSRHFGTELPQWKTLPGVTRLRCAGDCSAALIRLIEANADVARIAIEGDLQIGGSVQLGERAKPVVLVVDGELLLRGPVQIHGLVFARRMQWDGADVGSGALLHGAVLTAAGYTGDAGADLVYDPALMLRLKRQSGTWLRVPGSWRDF